jgi:hypothetical protein
MRADNIFQYPNRYGTAIFEVVPSSQYSSVFGYKTLLLEVLDKMGLPIMEVNIPDRKAYEIYNILDTAYKPLEESDTPSAVLRTIELPPCQLIRYSAIMNIMPEYTEMNILGTSIPYGQTKSAMIAFDPKDPNFMGFMGFMYINFEMPALKNDIAANYYYEHIKEY